MRIRRNASAKLMAPPALVKVAGEWFVVGRVSPSQVSEAIILRSRPYGESDKIVTFLSADAGKLTGIAKGAKNSRRRFANCLDPLTRVRVHFRVRPGGGMVFMESCDLLEPPGALSDPAKFAYGSYLTEVIDQLTGEAHPVHELHQLLAEALDELRRGPATAAFLRVFELQVLHHTGYEPQLRSCARCHRSLLHVAQAFFDPRQGSVVCAECRRTTDSLVPVAGETLSALDVLRATPLSEARKHRLAGTMVAEAAQLLGRLLALHLPRPLRSTKLIAALSG